MRIEIFAGGVKCTGPDAKIVLRLLFFILHYMLCDLDYGPTFCPRKTSLILFWRCRTPHRHLVAGGRKGNNFSFHLIHSFKTYI